MALITAANVKDYLPELSGTGADAIITTIIGRVENQFAKYIGFPLADSGVYTLDSTTYTVYIDNPMYGNPDVLELPIRPVSAVASLHSDVDRVYGSDKLIAASQYELDSEYARIILKPNTATQTYERGFRANKVVCTGGFAAAPADLAHAICYQTALVFRNRPNIGNDTISQRQASVKLRRIILEDEVREILFDLRPAGVVL